MKTLLQTLYRWRHYLLTLTASGVEPAFIPLTKEEIEIIQNPRDNSIGFFSGGGWGSQVLGLPVHETAYATLQRQRQVTMPVTRLEETAKVDESFEYVRENNYECARYLHRRMVARICTDTTNLVLKFEWDPLARLKRFLRVTRWFPVRTRTVAIDGKILYPYLKVTLPHNRHVVQFALS